MSRAVAESCLRARGRSLSAFALFRPKLHSICYKSDYSSPASNALRENASSSWDTPRESFRERRELTDKRGWPWEAVRQARPRDPFGTEEEAGGRGPLTSAL